MGDGLDAMPEGGGRREEEEEHRRDLPHLLTYWTYRPGVERGLSPGMSSEYGSQGLPSLPVSLSLSGGRILPPLI